MSVLGVGEVTGLPPTRAIATAGRLFAFAGSGALPAFLLTAPAACALAAADGLLWIPPPISAPVVLLSPGLIMGLVSVLPRRSWPGIALAGWLGGGCGALLVAALRPALAGHAPAALAQAFALATAATVAGVVGGALQELAVLRLRPLLTMRLLAATPGAVIGALCGVLVSWLLSGALPGRSDVTGGIIGFGAAFTGCALITPLIVIWWMATQGCVLSFLGSRRELVALVAALAVATFVGLQHWFPLQHIVGVILVLALLLLVGTRYPVRVVAPLTSLQFAILIAVWIALPAGHPGRSPSDPLALAAAQLSLTLLLLTILLLCSNHNGRLLAEERLRNYARELARTEDERRREAASSVRESLAQALVGVRFALDHLQRAQLSPEARLAVGDTLDVVRAAEAGADLSLREISPHGLEAAHLGEVLRGYLERVRAGAGADIELEVAGPLEDLSVPLRRLAFRSVSELVRNALRHGAPSRVLVTVRSDAHELGIAVEDDGRGFDPSSAMGGQAPRTELARLQARVVAEGGRFSLRSAPGIGCAVDLTIPLAGA